MVMEYVTVQPLVEIGRDTIVWSASAIGFGSRIGDHCWIVSARLGSSVSIGDYTFVGLNATVAPGSNVARRNVIGAGALIEGDTQEDQVFRAPASTASRVPSHRLRRL
jgi:UDP-3-O-[3-hydroxymyristoyl] glucosamine N-acyltransferase